METPLKDIHKKLKARFTDFVGWKMPLQYSSIVEEVKAVRSKVGIFDISHMGRILLEGKDVKEKLQFLTTNNVGKLSVGRVQYNLFTNEKGGVKDDITVYKLAEDKFFLCVNAVNKEKIIKWLSEFCSPRDMSEDYLQIAVQGPESESVLSKFFNVSDIRYYGFKTFGDTIVSRTGYTGEDGFEVYINPKEGIELFEELVRLAVPCGLGARDILRIEMGFPLYGNELSESITPFEANLDRFVDTNKDFLGKEEMLRKGVKEKLFGLELQDKGVPRKGYKIFKGNKEIGYISSGTFSPTLNKGIALCFVKLEERREGNEVDIAIRDKRVKARLRKYPFIRRK